LKGGERKINNKEKKKKRKRKLSSEKNKLINTETDDILLIQHIKADNSRISRGILK
jgi:hypothetical protein